MRVDVRSEEIVRLDSSSPLPVPVPVIFLFDAWEGSVNRAPYGQYAVGVVSGFQDGLLLSAIQ